MELLKLLSYRGLPNIFGVKSSISRANLLSETDIAIFPMKLACNAVNNKNSNVSYDKWALVGFIMVLLSKFQIIKTSLWSVFSGRFELMVYTFYFCALRNSIFQTSEAVQSCMTEPTRLIFWILNHKVGLKKLDIWSELDSKGILYLFNNNMQIWCQLLA